MTRETFTRGALMFLVALAPTFVVLATTPAMAAEDRDTVVRQALIERTDTFCKAVLPAWFATKGGFEDARLKFVVTDCYLGHARLALLGVESGLALEDTGLGELPAVLIQKETGMSLDIYRSLAGRTVRTGPPGK